MNDALDNATVLAGFQATHRRVCGIVDVVVDLDALEFFELARTADGTLEERRKQDALGVCLTCPTCGARVIAAVPTDEWPDVAQLLTAGSTVH